MTKLAWGSIGQRFYETGVDRGVLFVEGKPGVPWNGLTSVDENSEGEAPQSYFLDGVKYLQVAMYDYFAATINAFSCPPEFLECDGTKGIHNGLFATQQPRKTFGFSYRTKIGNDVDGTDHGYKIHLVYNALAAPTSRSYQSVGSSADPVALSWAVSTSDEEIPEMKPGAHLVIDETSAPPEMLEILKRCIYGTDTSDPYLPSIQVVYNIFSAPFDDLSAPVNYKGTGSAAKSRVYNLITDPVPSNTYIEFVANNPSWVSIPRGSYFPIDRFSASSFPEPSAPSNREYIYFQVTYSESNSDASGGVAFPEIKNLQPGIYTLSVYLRITFPNPGQLLEFKVYDEVGEGDFLTNEPFLIQTNHSWLRKFAVYEKTTAGDIVFSVEVAEGGSSWPSGSNLRASSAMLLNEQNLDFLYFDGDYPGRVLHNQTVKHAQWSGQPYRSTSFFEYYNLLNTPGEVGDAYRIEDHLWLFTDNGYWEDLGEFPPMAF